MNLSPEEAFAHGNHVAMAGQLVNVVSEYMAAPVNAPSEDQALAATRDLLDKLSANPATIQSVAFCLATMLCAAADREKLQAHVDFEFRSCKRVMGLPDDYDFGNGMPEGRE